MPAWIEGIKIQLYVFFMNRLYADEVYQMLGRSAMRFMDWFDKREQGWSR